ncbi:MAG: ribonuclease R, partial [Planctomycetota bacterium]
MSETSITERLLAWIHSPSYRPSKPSAIQRDLKLSDDEYRELRRAIKSLVREGRLEFGSNHLVYPPAAAPKARETNPAEPSEKASNRVVGVFRRSFGDGFGFVEIPRGTGVSMPDIFIPPSCRKNAMDGDTVRVRFRERRGKVEGEIEEVVARARREFTGTFIKDGGQSAVWIDGAKLEHPVQVGDVRGLPLETNDKVIVELVRYPDELHPGEAVILKVLGSLKNPAVDTLAVIHQ